MDGKTPIVLHISYGTRGKVKNMMRAGRIRFTQLGIAKITTLMDVKMKF